jgi:hypothetical protein
VELPFGESLCYANQSCMIRSSFCREEEDEEDLACSDDDEHDQPTPHQNARAETGVTQAFADLRVFPRRRAASHTNRRPDHR